jgi:D-xylose transport system substrate-binding protein
MISRTTISCIAATAVLLAACGAGPGSSGPAAAGASPGRSTAGPSAAGVDPSPGGCIVGVSWDSLTGRFADRDGPAIRDAVTASGGSYLETDAQGSADTQATDVQTLISEGARVLIILAQNDVAIGPSVAAAHASGIPVIAYDRLIDDPESLYITFDNVEVGRMQARALLKAVPTGNYAFIKGDQGDANSDLLRAGQGEVLASALKSGAITNVGETYTKDWAMDLATVEMESFLKATGNKVDAVLAENDGLAYGVLTALADHRLGGSAAVSGQDGDAPGLNAVALGSQTVDVWKDSRALGKAAGEAAVRLCGGATVASVGASDFTLPSGGVVRSILLAPVAVTRDNLDTVIDAGWITKDVLCEGVPAGSVPACS